MAAVHPEEHDERTDLVTSARTLGELPAIVDDLVAVTSPAVPVALDRRADAEHRYRRSRQQALISFLTPTLICWIIWVSVLTGGGTAFPWPAFVMIGTGTRWFQLAISKEDSILAIERDIEKKERRRLAAERRKELGGSPPTDGGSPPPTTS